MHGKLIGAEVGMSRAVSCSQRGIGLIEVLVTLLIMSTSLIALAALQTKSLQFNQGAYFRSQANIYAYDILERIRINSARLSEARENISKYTIEKAAFDSASTPPTDSMSAIDLYGWRKNIASGLPNGKGAIDCNDTDRVCEITIEWDELNSSGEESEDKTSFSYKARL
jgi:type IV pilus assembly protein PilV